jgi:hypothetical protein
MWYGHDLAAGAGVVNDGANCLIIYDGRTFRPIILALPPDAPPLWYPNGDLHYKAVIIPEARRAL